MPLPFLAAAFPLLQNKWVIYLGILLLSCTASYIGGCTQGAKGKEELKAEFDAYKTAQALIVKGIQDTAKKDALAANQKLKNQERSLEENERKAKKELASMRKKLDDVKLDLALVRLLNDSIVRGREDESVAGSGQQVDEPPDEGTSRSANIRAPTLGDLAELTIENNKNHLACVDQVKAWQEFYRNLYNKFE